MDVQALDCYGYLYDTSLKPCREECNVRESCYNLLKKRLREEGEENIIQKQRRIIMEYETDNGASQNKEKRSIEPSYSEIVLQISAILEELGLERVGRIAYIAFKTGKTNIFGITATKGKSLKNLVKFVYTKERNQFPESIQSNVTEKKHGGFHCVVAKDLEEFKRVVSIYIESISESGE